ncbi:MAG: CRISPR-associated protein Cas4 [Deltaproteobacteria bacterium]|nr:CRISPR-associated protein Cas4 [Deltaproteobacteria bacterium]
MVEKPLPSEDKYIMVSAIEHYSYCPRQCALIHLEQTFDENLYTLRGNAVHEVVHEESSRLNEGIRFERSLPIWSERLGLVGKADMVEFEGNVPYPVEYKSGRHKAAGIHEHLQLCAQAICLEEMLGLSVEKGAVFWHSSRKRQEVVFTEVMRNAVKEVSGKIRRMIEERHMPEPPNDSRCRHCSLKESCMPSVIVEKQKLKAAVKKLLRAE